MSDRKFCRKYSMDKSVTFLLFMDLFGMSLYVCNILGFILGYAGQGQGLYFSTVVNKIPILLDLNTIVLAVSSLIISMVSIPRFFAYIFVK